MSQFSELLPALPELVIALGTLALLLAGVARREFTDGATYGGVLILIVAILILAVMGPERSVIFNGLFVADGFAAFAKILVMLAAALALIMARSWMVRENLARFEFPVLMLFATLGMLMMISANSLISLYVGLELQSLSLYVLAAYDRDNPRSTEAGLKYFVLGSLASGMLLYGISLIYGFAGATGFDTLAKAVSLHPPVGVTVGLVFVLAGLAFKIAAVPFHMWTPDVYEGAPTPVTAFFGVAPKIAAFALLVRVLMVPFSEMAPQWGQIVVFISLASMVVGAFGAITQTNIKRLMAYSSIGHVGYALVGLAVFSATGVRAVLIYLAIYLFMNVGTFAVILAMRQKGRLLEGIDDLAGLSRTHPGMALCLAVFMFSMAGIPPLAGFWSKFYIFMAAVDAGMYTLAVMGVLTSVVAAYYYLRIIKVMYFDEPAEALDRGAGTGLGLIMGVNALVIVLFTLMPAPLVSGAGAAAAALFRG